MRLVEDAVSYPTRPTNAAATVPMVVNMAQLDAASQQIAPVVGRPVQLVTGELAHPRIAPALSALSMHLVGHAHSVPVLGSQPADRITGRPL